MSTDSKSGSLTAIYLKLVLSAVFWGGTFVAGRMVSQEAGPFSAAFLRFTVASFFLFLFVLRSHGSIPLPERREFFRLLLLGLTGVFAYNSFFFSGLQTVPAGRASLIIAANPVFIALFAALLYRERLGFLKIFGICLSIAGAATVISRGDPAALLKGQLGLGELYILCCVASWVAYSLLGKAALKDLSPLLAVTYACALGTLLLFPAALNEGVATAVSGYSATVWACLFFLGFFASALAFIWYYEGIRAIGASRAGAFLNLVPLSAVLLAFLILQEGLDSSLVLGAAGTISGVYLTNRA
ncbi:MAG: DMT family transporter [Desulfobacteraceae bacterium]|nr:DMT family transporter [Desulfobacteraceae bacterium]